MRDDGLRLADILDAIGQIEKYSQRARAAFDEDELIRVWILHHLEIIGEPRIPRNSGRTSSDFETCSFTSISESILRPSGKLSRAISGD